MSSPEPAAPAPQPATTQPLSYYDREQQDEARFNKSLKGQRDAARRASNRLGVSSSGTAQEKVSLLGGRASSALL